nr:MAG TPA: hypothetical protein [Bacteriophage sp.]
MLRSGSSTMKISHQALIALLWRSIRSKKRVKNQILWGLW